MFRAHVLIIRRSKLHYTASGIITPIGARWVLCNWKPQGKKSLSKINFTKWFLAFGVSSYKALILLHTCYVCVRSIFLDLVTAFTFGKDSKFKLFVTIPCSTVWINKIITYTRRHRELIQIWTHKSLISSIYFDEDTKEFIKNAWLNSSDAEQCGVHTSVTILCSVSVRHVNYIVKTDDRGVVKGFRCSRQLWVQRNNNKNCSFYFV